MVHIDIVHYLGAMWSRFTLKHTERDRERKRIRLFDQECITYKFHITGAR